MKMDTAYNLKFHIRDKQWIDTIVPRQFRKITKKVVPALDVAEKYVQTYSSFNEAAPRPEERAVLR